MYKSIDCKEKLYTQVYDLVSEYSFKLYELWDYKENYPMWRYYQN